MVFIGFRPAPLSVSNYGKTILALTRTGLHTYVIIYREKRTPQPVFLLVESQWCPKKLAPARPRWIGNSSGFLRSKARCDDVCGHAEGERRRDGGWRSVAERGGECGQHGGGAWRGGSGGHLCVDRCGNAVAHAENERCDGGRRFGVKRRGVREQHVGDERRLDNEQRSEGEQHGQKLDAERRKEAGLHDGCDRSDTGAAHEVGELRSGGSWRLAAALRGAREQHAGRARLGGAVRYAGEGPEGGEREGGALTDDAATSRRGAGREAPARWTAAPVPPA
jgi:hypothetical protein